MSKHTIFKAIVYLFLLFLAVFALVFWFIYNGEQSRDYQRLGDLKIIQSEMADYFAQYNTYVIPECNPEMTIDQCVGKGDRHLANSKFFDPINSGNYRYIVKSLSDDDFAIQFYLEAGVSKVIPGGYLWTKNGKQ